MDFRHVYEKFTELFLGNYLFTSILFVPALSFIFARKFLIFLLPLSLIFFLFYTCIWLREERGIRVNGGVYRKLMGTYSRKETGKVGVLLFLTHVVSLAFYVLIFAGALLYPVLPSISSFVPPVQASIFVVTSSILLLLCIMLRKVPMRYLRILMLPAFFIHTLFVLSLLASGILIILTESSQPPGIFPHTPITYATIPILLVLVGLPITGFEKLFVEKNGGKRNLFSATLRNLVIANLLFSPVLILLFFALPVLHDTNNPLFILPQTVHFFGGTGMYFFLLFDMIFLIPICVFSGIYDISLLEKAMHIHRLFVLYEKDPEKHEQIFGILILLAGIAVLVLSLGNMLALAGIYILSVTGLLGYVCMIRKKDLLAVFAILCILIMATACCILFPASTGIYIMGTGIILLYITKKGSLRFGRIIQDTSQIFILFSQYTYIHDFNEYIRTNIPDSTEIILVYCAPENTDKSGEIEHAIQKSGKELPGYSISYEYYEDTFADRLLEDFIMEKGIPSERVFFHIDDIINHLNPVNLEDAYIIFPRAADRTSQVQVPVTPK